MNLLFIYRLFPLQHEHQADPVCVLDFLLRAAELLCVPAEELLTCLRVRMLKAGKQSVLKPCSLAECSTRRDCLAKVIYAQYECPSFHLHSNVKPSFLCYQ